jgi:hypothetical protein
MAASANPAAVALLSACFAATPGAVDTGALAFWVACKNGHVLRVRVCLWSGDACLFVNIFLFGRWPVCVETERKTASAADIAALLAKLNA